MAIFEDSHIPLHKWLLAIHLLCASKKGMSAHQLMRMLDIGQYKSAWFMAHRIRYAMTGELAEKMDGIVEADETYIGGRRRRHQSQTVNGASVAFRKFATFPPPGRVELRRAESVKNIIYCEVRKGRR